MELARAGDEHAFRALTEPYRRELLVHCYRMLGSLTDAEDLVQETLLAAWRGLDGYRQQASVRTWLYRIATNRCLNALRAGRRAPVEPVPPFTPPEPGARDEITWLQPIPDTLLPESRAQAAENIELAFVAGLQRLPPRQLAVLLLRDVLGYETGEVAELLDTSPAAVKGALQRARAGLRAAEPAPSRATDREAAVEQRTARRFARAYEDADLDTLLALLTDDAWLSMPPAPHRYRGRAEIAAFYRAALAWRGDRRVRLLPAGRANTHPAFGSYLYPQGTPSTLFVLDIAGERIRALTQFHDPALHARFGLPGSLPEITGGL